MDSLTLNESYDKRRRRRARVDTPVCIQTPQQPAQTINGAMTNLSDSGMFVTTDHLCSVDDELICNLCLPEPHPTLPVKGRVVWVQDEPNPGMGIQFIGLGEPHRNLLRQVVQPAIDGEEVKVWLETLTHPIRAQVVRTDQGLHLQAPLPFLRLLSSVVVYPVECPEKGFSGSLAAVTLSPGDNGVPELKLHLDFEPSDLVDDGEAIHGEEIELVALPQKEPPETIPDTIPDTIPEASSEKPSDPDPEQPPEQAAGEFEIRKQPTLELIAEPSVETELQGSRSRDDLLEVEEPPYSMPSDSMPSDAQTADPEDSDWSFQLEVVDPSEQSQWTLNSEQVEQSIARTQPRRRFGNLWLWLAALTLLTFTAASMVHTNAWSRAWRWTRAHLSNDGPLPPLPTSKATIVPVEAPTPPIPPKSSPPKIVTETPSSKSVTKPDSPMVKANPLVLTNQPEPAKGPHVMEEGTRRVLVVPIKGTVRNAIHYRLADPDGLVVNLPNARPKVSFGSYVVSHRPFRTVWLRRRDKGMHLRVIFKGKLPDYRLKLHEGAIRVVLDPK